MVVVHQEDIPLPDPCTRIPRSLLSLFNRPTLPIVRVERPIHGPQACQSGSNQGCWGKASERRAEQKGTDPDGFFHQQLAPEDILIVGDAPGLCAIGMNVTVIADLVPLFMNHPENLRCVGYPSPDHEEDRLDLPAAKPLQHGRGDFPIRAVIKCEQYRIPRPGFQVADQQAARYQMLEPVFGATRFHKQHSRQR